MTVAVCTVHALMALRRDPALREAVNNADIATPDGVPLVWAIRWTADLTSSGYTAPSLMRRTLISDSPEYRHYLFGSTPETDRAPHRSSLGICAGSEHRRRESPPFRDADP